MSSKNESDQGNRNEIRITTGCSEEQACPKKKRKRVSAQEDMTLTILIEIPKGSRNKYEWDKERKIIKFDRMLFSAVHYPSDYGFILDTLAEDSDPLDALVLVSEPTFPGCLIDAKPVGLFRMWDEKGPDEKILCVPMGDPHWNFIKELSDVPAHLLKEIEHFFNIYKELEEKKTGVEGWEDRDSAIKAVLASRKRYAGQKKEIGASII
ncbi:Inorganic diphosphatase [Dehalogenimonas lykanthroporepellens BL-DC-9]|nr:Inorganic diphosphatase [Dehalogenimonas lykanthroporepellens BL-DC-9]